MWRMTKAAPCTGWQLLVGTGNPIKETHTGRERQRWLCFREIPVIQISYERDSGSITESKVDGQKWRTYIRSSGGIVGGQSRAGNLRKRERPSEAMGDTILARTRFIYGQKILGSTLAERTAIACGGAMHGSDANPSRRKKYISSGG